MTPTPDSPYREQVVGLLTQHGKERVIAPALETALGCRLRVVGGFDTDQLGTFTRDIARAGSQLEAARRKAQLAIERSGLPFGIGSEGAFGPDPMVGAMPWNAEVLVFIDAQRGLEVVGEAQGPGLQLDAWARDWADVVALAQRVGFPAQQLVLGIGPDGTPPLIKGLDSWPTLEAAYAQQRARSSTGKVWVETDLRAHANPTRMAMIGQAAADLAARLQQQCPCCGTPGFWKVQRLAGLPCAACGAPTRLTRAWVHRCLRCQHHETRVLAAGTLAAPERCDHCNP
jgi:hypothetical protein